MYGWSGLVTDPVTGEQRFVTDTPITTVDVLASGTDVYHDSTGAIIGTGSPSVGGQSFSAWLNANGTTVALGVGGLLVVMMFAKAGR